jgi:hypothetical protein
MECYALETVHECDVPMFFSVPRAYVITMHATETFPWLHGVARRTYVQRNRGFRACFKARGDGQRVDSTNQDIIHAYRAVFARERNTTEPVLVFEDDALLTRTAKDDMPHVDRFVATHNFSVYSLGSFGAIVPHEQGHWRFWGSRRYFAFAHAMIYSPSCVRAILGFRNVRPQEAIDSTIIAEMPGLFTYHRPLAYQPVSIRNRSENSHTWCVVCDGGVFGNIYDSVLREVTYACMSVLGLHKEDGWSTMYTIQKAFVPVLAIIVGLIAGLLVSRLALRKQAS